MKFSMIYVLLFVVINLNAFSTTNIQVLYGGFDGNSYIYDTKNGGKTTFTLEHFSTNNIGSVFVFMDYAVADNRFKYHDNRDDLYGEIAPRFNLNYFFDTKLVNIILSDVYIVGEYNRGQTDKYKAYLYGLGADFKVYGFDNFGLNFYIKNQNIGKNTLQMTGIYGTQIMDTKFYFTGYFDWTEADFTTQNQFLYNILSTFGGNKAYVGLEWIIYNEKPSSLNYSSKVNSNTVQAILKYEW